MQDQEKQQIAQNLGFRSTEDAARQLGYQAGLKHDQTHPTKSYRLSVTTTAELLAEELNLYPEVRPVFVDAYRKGCREERDRQKRNIMYTPILFDVRTEKEEENDTWLISRLDYNDQETITWIPLERESRYQRILDDMELDGYRLVHSDGPYTYYRIPAADSVSPDKVAL